MYVAQRDPVSGQGSSSNGELAPLPIFSFRSGFRKPETRPSYLFLNSLLRKPKITGRISRSVRTTY